MNVMQLKEQLENFKHLDIESVFIKCISEDFHYQIGQIYEHCGALIIETI